MILISTKQVPKEEQHFHAHMLLRRCLQEYGVDYIVDKTPLLFGEHGKPSLAEYPELHYNISHADGIAAAMVSAHECGIDCERIRSYDRRVMKRAFSEREQQIVENAVESERELLFFSLWTLKESYVKALGKGILFPLRKVEFDIECGRIRTNLNGCRFSRYVIDRDFVVSVCELTGNYGKILTDELQTSDSYIFI